MKTIRIFISSPGDVAVERDKARQALEDGRTWNDELRNDFRLLHEAGHDHPDMKKIEALLDANEQQWY